jgi:hypothetical protein
LADCGKIKNFLFYFDSAHVLALDERSEVADDETVKSHSKEHPKERDYDLD